MKKLLLILAITSLAVSCQNDSTSTDTTNGTPILPVKITSSDGVTTFEYIGNHLYKIKEDGNLSATYTYTGDLITEIQYVDGETSTLSYDSAGRLIKMVETVTGSNPTTTTISYPTSTSAIIIEKNNGTSYNKTVTKNVNLNIDGSIKNGTATEVVIANGTTTTATGTISATYDDKNSPYLNIAGFKKITFIHDEPGVDHNYLSYKYSVSDASGLNYSFTNEKATHQYNGNGYPTITTIAYYNQNNVQTEQGSYTVEYNQ